MTQQTVRRRVDDVDDLLLVTMQQRTEAGILAAKDLTGYTVTFKMINAADGTTKVADSATGVTVTGAAAGEAQKEFAAADVDTAGVYWATFIATASSKSSSYPVATKDLRVMIDSDTQTAEEAHAAALRALS